MKLWADIALPIPLGRTLAYAVPAELEDSILVGVRVRVPLGERPVTGFVVGLSHGQPDPSFVLKNVAAVLDERPVFPQPYLKFTRRLSDYYHSSWGEILEASLPPSFSLRPRERVALTPKAEEYLEHDLLTEKEKELAKLLGKKVFSPLYLEKRVRVRDFASLLGRMEKKGLVVLREKKRVSRRKKPEEALPATQLELDFSLDEESRRAAGLISRGFAEGIFRPYYLFGPAERRDAVYFETIRTALAAGGKTLILIPEISLTRALREKFERRLGEKAVLLHSRLTERQKEEAWSRIRQGKADVVAGPRSALFAPMENLRFIIVEDEQDESYIQQESPSYDARRGAWLRAEEERAVLVCGSAAPSVEAFHLALEGGYLVSLGAGSGEKKALFVDSRKVAGIVGRELLDAIGRRLEKRERIYIFSNRRGYAPYIVCSRCGWIPRCSRCDLALVFHKKENRMICHACRSSAAPQDLCPQCGSRIFKKRGWGVEAVEEEILRHFHRCRVRIVDRDTVRRKSELEKARQAVEKGEVDIVIGTQLLAHQADWPEAPLIGILNPEVALNRADFRSSQKTFQSVGRMMSLLGGEPSAEAFIQTEFPPHFSVRAAAEGHYRAFFESEIEFRRLMNDPPFSHMAEITLQGGNLRTLAGKARDLASEAKASGEPVEILGPALASQPRPGRLSRVQVTIKASNKNALDSVLSRALPKIRLKKSVSILS